VEAAKSVDHHCDIAAAAASLFRLLFLFRLRPTIIVPPPAGFRNCDDGEMYDDEPSAFLLLWIDNGSLHDEE
jgi:hypothetical protein